MKYEELLSFAEQLPPGLNQFEDIGLILESEPSLWDYDSTPKNSVTFATTGGDGVHFNFLAIDGKWSEQSPVIMTVPMNFGEENLVIGDSLEDFLSLGIDYGYFGLEQLSYDKEGTIAKIEAIRESERSPELNALKERFELSTWENVASRLEMLNQEHFEKFEIEE